VLNLGFFTTRVRTDWGDEVNLPNAMIVGMATRNYSRTSVRQGYLVDTQVTIGYDAAWRQVEAMLVEAARRTPGILAEPRPRILQAGLQGFYPVYQLLCLTAAGESRPRTQPGGLGPLGPHCGVAAPCLAYSQAASPRLALGAHWPERDPRRECQQTLTNPHQPGDHREPRGAHAPPSATLGGSTCRVPWWNSPLLP
jgi:hypothetical protein